MAQPSVGQLRQSIVLCLRDERREGRRFASGSPDIEQRAEMSTARGFAYPQLGTCERALMGSLVPPRESKRRLEERAAAGATPTAGPGLSVSRYTRPRAKTRSQAI